MPVLIPKPSQNGNVIHPSSGTHVIESYETSSSGSIYSLLYIFMEDPITIAGISGNDDGVTDNSNPSVTVSNSLQEEREANFSNRSNSSFPLLLYS